MKTNLLILIVLSIIVSACCSKNNTDQARKQIEATDLKYSAFSEKAGFHAALLAMFETTGVLLRDGHEPVQGIRQIRELLGRNPDTSYTVTWKPINSFVAESCDMGYSFGTYLVKSRQGDIKLGDGTYITIWKKDLNGEWRAVLDTGTDGLSGK